MPDFIEQLRRRLLELGCPVDTMQRLVRELADHRADLVAANEAEGLAISAAEARAELRLGNPKTVAEDLMTAVRRSTWCGRHAFITFGLLPLLMLPVFWGLVLFINLSIEFAVGFGWDHTKLHAAANNPAAFDHLAQAAHGADGVAIALAFFLFCLLARRAAAGLKWTLLTGLICAVYALFSCTHVSPHHFTIGLTWKPQWIRAAIPLVMMGIAYWNQRHLVRAALKVPASAAQSLESKQPSMI